MKKYIYQLLCSLFIGGTMVACAEDYMETDKQIDLEEREERKIGRAHV